MADARPHVLFVDDEPAVLAGLRRMLRERRDRWDMSFAGSAQEALDLLAGNRVDVVVSDMRMPGTSGSALLQAVRDRYPGVARLILSGHTDEADLLKVVLLAHQFVAKPCTQDELIQAVERLLRLRTTLCNDDVRREITGIESLPSPPSALRELLAVVQSEDATPRVVAETLSRDPATTAKILHLVNSASFGLRHRVSDVTQAVTLLGLSNVRALVLLHDLVHDFHVPDLPVPDWVDRLTRHCVETSRLARLLSDGRPWADDAFAAGLLLEIGQLVLATCRPHAFALHLDTWQHTDLPLAKIETGTFGVDHAAAGAYLLGLWALPAPIIEAVAAHTHPLPTAEHLSGLVPTVTLAHCLVETELGPMCSPHSATAVVDQAVPPSVRYRVAQWRERLRAAAAED